MRSGMTRCSRAVQAFDAVDRQFVAADAFDARAHRIQAGRQVADLGFARGVHQHAAAIGQRSRHQQVLGGADRNEREHDGRAAQATCHARIDIAARQFDARAHLLQPFQVQIDRAGADGAAAGQRYARLAGARQQRAEYQDGRAHLAHDVVGRLGAGDRAA